MGRASGFEARRGHQNLLASSILATHEAFCTKRTKEIAVGSMIDEEKAAARRAQPATSYANPEHQTRWQEIRRSSRRQARGRRYVANRCPLPTHRSDQVRT